MMRWKDKKRELRIGKALENVNSLVQHFSTGGLRPILRLPSYFYWVTTSWAVSLFFKKAKAKNEKFNIYRESVGYLAGHTTQPLQSFIDRKWAWSVLYFCVVNVGLCDFLMRKNMLMVLRVHHQWRTWWTEAVWLTEELQLCFAWASLVSQG